MDGTCAVCGQEPCMPRSKIGPTCFELLKSSGSGKFFTAAEYVAYIGALIFLAGPIQGAEDWHSDAFRIIRGLDPNISAASPRRYTLDKPKEYNEQVDWETFYLNAAGFGQGCILFWLARQQKKELVVLLQELIDRFLKGEDARAFAQTSRIEVSRWCERIDIAGARVVIGIEPGFTGEKYIRTTFPNEYSGIQIVDTLEETCRIAVDLANSKDEDSVSTIRNRNLKAQFKGMDVRNWYLTDKYGIIYGTSDDFDTAAKIAEANVPEGTQLRVYSGSSDQCKRIFTTSKR